MQITVNLRDLSLNIKTILVFDKQDFDDFILRITDFIENHEEVKILHNNAIHYWHQLRSYDWRLLVAATIDNLTIDDIQDMDNNIPNVHIDHLMFYIKGYLWKYHIDNKVDIEVLSIIKTENDKVNFSIVASQLVEIDKNYF